MLNVLNSVKLELTSSVFPDVVWIEGEKRFEVLYIWKPYI